MKDLKTVILLFAAFTLLCGGLYPLFVTVLAQAVFPRQANGSLRSDHSGRTVGSDLIGQPFSAPKYFWPRPSASAGFGYNPQASGGSNAGPTNPAYLQSVARRVEALRDLGATGPIPADLVQASASGLDPHLSPQAAYLQVARVARSRGLDAARLAELVTARVEGRQLGILGAPRVNVLALNLDLDRLHP